MFINNKINFGVIFWEIKRILKLINKKVLFFLFFNWLLRVFFISGLEGFDLKIN